MTYPALLFLTFLLWSFAWPKENLVYLLFGTAAFGSLAVFPPSWVGGVNLLPSSLAALVLTARYFVDRRFLAGLLRNGFSPDRMGLLTAFMAVATVSALFFPRLFAGQVEVTEVRGAATALLGPTTANFTQLAYLSISFLVAVAIESSAANPKFVEKVLQSFLLGGVLLVASGLADLALGGAGASPILAPFKTADYTLMDAAEVLGAHRVVGFMSEASAYGSTCVTFGAVALFSSAVFTETRQKLLARVVAISLLIMAALSTSSTAFVGDAIVLVLYLGNFARRTISAFLPGRQQAMRFLLLAEMGVLYLVLAVLALSIVFTPEVFLTPAAFVDELVFKKSLGGSYLERMQWNNLAMEALAATHWVGVGVGGARTSNWVVAVLSNTGAIGAALLFGFVGMALFRPGPRRNPRLTELLIGARACTGISLLMGAMAGTSPDFGVAVGALFGVIIANLPKAVDLPVFRRGAPLRRQRLEAARALLTPSLAARLRAGVVKAERQSSVGAARASLKRTKAIGPPLGRGRRLRRRERMLARVTPPLRPGLQGATVDETGPEGI